MAIRIRTTENHPHTIWEKLIQEFNVAEIQGFIFTCSDEELENATRNKSKDITIQCLEAAEYDNDEEFIAENFFSKIEWENKIKASKFFNSSLLFLTHKPNDIFLFKLHKVDIENDQIVFSQVNQFVDEQAFISWWRSIKNLSQSKGTVEARSRQNNTIFDNIIERNGLSWGGNMDGFILSDNKNNVRLIVEIRLSRTFPIERYDPANYFAGTQTKGGDYKTWLPLIYLKKAYEIPVILITFSTISNSSFGYSEIDTISRTKLFYVNNIPPTKNVNNDFSVLKNWINQLINR